MILLSADDWMELDPYAEFVQFDCTLVKSSTEQHDIDISETLIGMEMTDTFELLKNGIASFCEMDKRIIHLFWNDNQLYNAHSPQLVGMQPVSELIEKLVIYVSFIET